METDFDRYIATTMGGAKNAADGSSLTQEQVERVANYLRSAGSGVDENSSFMDFVRNKLNEQPPKLPDGTAYVGFSGKDSLGESNYTNAKSYVEHKSSAAGAIENTPWGRYLTGSAVGDEMDPMAQKFGNFLAKEGIAVWGDNPLGSLQDMMWNAGSPEYFKNAVDSGRPVVAFVENAPKNRGFSNFELPVALENPDTIVNGYPTRAFGSGDDALKFASNSAAEYQALERSIAEAATRNSGREVSVAEVRKSMDLADGYNATNKTVFDVPRASFEQLNIDSMTTTADEWSATRVAARSPRIATAVEPELRGPSLDAHPSTGRPLTNTDAPARLSNAPEVESPRLGGAGTAVLGGAAFVAAAYDAKQTGDRMGTAYAQDNPAAAQSEATHFLARTGGGAAAGLTIYGAGVSGGPAVALAVADAYLLMEAAERGAKFLDVRKITHQTGSDGADYAFNGKQWIRDDLRADFRDDGVDQLRKQDFAAEPKIERELNAKASAEAVGQAIGSTDPRNPFVQPANESDPAHLKVSDWMREPTTGRWSRQFADEVDRNDALVWNAKPEYASDQRADELNRQASAVIDRNIVEGPAVFAAHYQLGYKRNGFGDFGPEPEAVATALDPNSLEASNGKQYLRDAQGQWSNDGSPATGNLALELEATRERLIPALQQHQAHLAEAPAWQPPTPEQQDRRMLRLAYNNEGWNPSDEQFEASYLAVKRTRQMSDLRPEDTGLILEKDATGLTSLSSPILLTRVGPNNEVQVVAKTYPDEIEVALSDVRARGLGKGTAEQAAPVLAIDPATGEQREVREQAQREANRAGLSQDDAQAAIRTVAPALSGAKEKTPGGPNDEVLDTAPAKRTNGADPTPTATVPPDFAPSQQGPRDIRDPQHEGNEAYREMQHKVKAFETQQGIAHGPHSDRMAASMLAFSVERGLHYSEVSLEKNQDTGQVQLKHTKFGEPAQRFDVDLGKMSSQPIEVSSQRINEAVSKHYGAPAPALERTREQAQGLGDLSFDDKVMFARIRSGIPGHISDDHVAQAMVAAKKSGMDSASVGQVSMVGDQIRVAEAGPAGRTALVDVNAPAQPLQVSVKEASEAHQQQVLTQQQAMTQQQKQQQDGHGGPTMGARSM